jgi:hypothetical protein
VHLSMEARESQSINASLAHTQTLIRRAGIEAKTKHYDRESLWIKRDNDWPSVMSMNYSRCGIAEAEPPEVRRGEPVKQTRDLTRSTADIS